MIKIDLNKELDYEVYKDFYDFSTAGVDFGQKIRNEHPNITIENYKKYIDDFYITNQADIQNKQKQISELLSEKQNMFLLELEKMFKIDFSNDAFQGYLSIFNCNPRWPETRTFQVYYKKVPDSMFGVACHESLHFAFFDYMDKNFYEQLKKLDKNSGVLWELSEIFNVIVLNLPEFKNIINQEEKLFYPQLQDKLDKANKTWDNCSDVGEFVSKYLAEARQC